ncbi:hypothetical protein TWF192_009898 [Orbilia oligospora]|uniref:Uncharacterized protein n=1 Tax=Orbilia oligospora TaxID=2813651 RepID=A0A6G1MJ40_ORBOL|nr:hypothetical protein TWF679_010725 [Orbilia oligospora]KAF3217818.1 hypothetical protein TWF191_008448 [Orbilia oligospora]KAF3260617.1 hypothetical protein TWF192_009898 [Orbilia oligospora]
MLFYYLAEAFIHVLQLAYLRFRPTSVRGAAYICLTLLLLISPSIILIILAERKLNPLALVFLLIGAATHIAKSSISFYQGYAPKKAATTRILQWPLWITLVLSLATTSVFILCGLEGLILSSRGGLDKLRADLHPIFLIPSIILGILNALEYSESNQKKSSNAGDFKSTDLQADYATSRGAMDAVAMFVCTFLLFLQTPTWVQLISYGSIAIASTLAVFKLCGAINIKADLPQVEIMEDDNHELEDYSATRKLLDNEEISIRRKKSRLQGSYYSFTLKLWILFASLVGTKLLLERPSHNTRIDQITANIHSDTTLPKNASMDIVVSYFKENVNGIEKLLEEVREIEQLRVLELNVIIYTKNNESDVQELQRRFAAHEVRILPNEGREGGTYLRHIIDRYDTLATHTLFIQAEPHSKSRLISRIKLYFDPSRTGMLDLGYRELRGCKCLDCRDEYSWRDVTGLIPDLMAQAHHIKCDENTQVATSYKGQFIVSSKRIRAAKKALYENLNEKLVGENRVVIGNPLEDRIDAPFFGYSLERSWAVLFQCADLTAMRDMCPGLTLLPKGFGDFQKAQPEDCGCLDI